jgi:cytidyltransferase-like protein
VPEKYTRVATGGTFDHIHRGHTALLRKSFEVGDEVIIGVTSDEFASREGKRPDFDYEERVRQLKSFLKEHFPGRKYIIAKLFDYFGPGIASPEVKAIVASKETARRVPLANKMRAERGYPPLRVVIIDHILADDGKPISSTRIRSGEIDTDGRLMEKRRPPGRKGI